MLILVAAVLCWQYSTWEGNPAIDVSVKAA
jgi:hypothetical protein